MSVGNFSTWVCEGLWVWGERGKWERTRVPPEFWCSGWVDLRGLHTLSTRPWVGVWLCEATDPTRQVVDKGQPLIPGSQSLASHAGYSGGAGNRIGAPGRPWRYRKRGQGKRGPLGGSHTGESPYSSLYDQRQSMVYCRKAGRKEKR